MFKSGRIRYFLGIITFIIGAQAHAQYFGLGVTLGSPTGLSAKVYLKPTSAIDAALAWRTSQYERLYFHTSYLFHKHRAFRLDGHPFSVFYGPGLRIITRNFDTHPRYDESDELLLAFRAPLGIAYRFRDPAIELFGETALLVNIIPNMNVLLDFAVGGRFYF